MARGATPAAISLAKAKAARAFGKQLTDAGISGFTVNRGLVSGNFNGRAFAFHMRYQNASNGETFGTPYGLVCDIRTGATIWETPGTFATIDDVSELWATRERVISALLGTG